MKEVRLILGDQLNARHSWLKEPDEQVLFVMAEMRQETDYVVHHVQKLLAFFAAMRKFAEALQSAGHRVRYFTLDESADYADLPELLRATLNDEQATSFAYQAPDEYRLDQQLASFCESLKISTHMDDTEHFLTARSGWQDYPNSRMEFFYRALRKTYKVLLDDDGKPLGERWNFDQENRESLPKDKSWPEPLTFSEDVSELLAMIKHHDIKFMGEVDAKAFLWPTTRKQARELLSFFLEHCLVDFGRYQDAMTDSGWSLFHSRLSFCLNSKMLHPLEVIRAVEKHWQEHQDTINLAQVEGFIRQVLGWREYVRAIYWQHMPEYATHNALKAERPLPDYYWTGDTQMACMSHSIKQSLTYAYAHHIQRLMVTGNFALLAGVHPDAVDAWYLGIYIDAIEWVEMPNTRGMSQFADGGIIASKPYVSSGQYLRKMSNYCKGCGYDVKQKTGEGSCPFNSLYWHFLHRHRAQFANNHRMKMMYANWDRQDASQREAILATADQYLKSLNEL
ncbi:cryptochrome/photolyase family protein [Aliidiomarina minuta]|uniref:Cryptochrome/photolyase family protein n=1 Tax=Aliidiomarina minuta TaxID=880057 RepID=A0A432W671_9GAMM|nr:cryptochrome/photolyase family protein [Aliidiomarina minuta]RUO25574.1 cryptochrome/photolyase family protein [Aliidiomarina minuta]